MKKTIRAGLGVVVAVVLMGSLTACWEDNTLAVPQSFCGFTQGKGGRDSSNNANDAKLDKVLYEGQSADYQGDEQIGRVFPCVQRNYVVSPEGQSGDSHVPLTGLTADKVPVKGWVSTYWQPNQSNAEDQGNPIRQFIGFAQGKYGAAADDSSAFTGSDATNASTPGWNKMLAENMQPTLQRTFERAVAGVNNDVWQKQDPKLREQIAQDMSTAFAAEFQKVTGSTADLICGAGSTGNSNGQFDCKQVFVYVDGVFAQDDSQQSAAAKSAADTAKNALDEATKQADINLTNDKYGPLAPAYRACRDLNAAQQGSCKFITGANGVQIQVP